MRRIVEARSEGADITKLRLTEKLARLCDANDLR